MNGIESEMKSSLWWIFLCFISTEIGNRVESSVVGFHPVINTKDTLYTLSGDVAETLRIDAPDEGIYTVDITSIKTESYVKVFATTSPDVDRFPELPQDSHVKEVEKSAKSFTVVWNPSPDERHFGNDIEYCVAVNRKRSYKTLCSVLSHLHGDPKPTLPPNFGFGFSTDVYRKKHVRQTAKPIKPAKKGSIHYKCVGSDKKFTYDNIGNGKGYFVDVYVKNNQSGKSRQYHGVFVKTKQKRKKFSRLKEGKLTSVNFSRKKKKHTYSFKIKRSTKDVHLAISTCIGTTLVEVMAKNGTFHKSRIKSSQVLSFKGVQPGVYTLALSKSVSKRQTVYISMTSKIKAKKMPVLPEDTTVKVFDYLSTCNSVTVAWMGTEKKQKYCLYKSELSSSHDNSTSISKKLNQCDAFDRNQNGAQKITCKKFRYRKKEKSVLAITVAGLKPDTEYIFDVFVNKGNYFSFPYNSVRTKTRTDCYLPT
ncbi:protein NDNF-like isoform X3 [Ruditapes philippinarum]|uniref:protein NDNF-like isoform X3 n=1 Tax=Ruditapes philippinarum TaxID=129788 RepID=UPI00295B5778|nr:protein NDNF-like isoform X3 [Ruditapes philippinarum]